MGGGRLWPLPQLDAAPAVVAKTEVEWLRRYLGVSQAALEAKEWEMQVVRD
jgi:hypothetical protein